MRMTRVCTVVVIHATRGVRQYRDGSAGVCCADDCNDGDQPGHADHDGADDEQPAAGGAADHAESHAAEQPNDAECMFIRIRLCICLHVCVFLLCVYLILCVCVSVRTCMSRPACVYVYLSVCVPLLLCVCPLRVESTFMSAVHRHGLTTPCRNTTRSIVL